MRKIGFIKIVGIIAGIMVTCVGIVFNIRETVMIAGYAVNPSILLGVGFSLFAGFMGWIVHSQQKRIYELEGTNRPIITIGSTIKGSTYVRDADSKVDTTMRLGFRNGGNRPAYRIHVKIGYAPAQRPDLFRPESGVNNPNRIDPGVEFAIDFRMTQKFAKTPEGKRGVVSIETLVYCGIRYSDSPIDGQWHEDEWWFKYTLDDRFMSFASIQQKEMLEPYVRNVFK